MIVSGRASIDRFPLDVLGEQTATEFVSRRYTLANGDFLSESAFSADGRRLVARLAGGDLSVIDLANRGPLVRMKSVPSFSWFVAISPNGRWVAP